jgi:excisionase family DNA binding protein
MVHTPDISTSKEIFSNQEAADFLKVSTVTLYRERKKGKIDFRRIGLGKIVFTRHDLESYLERQKRVAYAVK